MKKYIAIRLVFAIPLLITLVVAGSGLVFLYSIPNLADLAQTLNALKIYLFLSTLLSFVVGLALAYALMVPLQELAAASQNLTQADSEVKKRPAYFEREIEELFSSLDKTKFSLLAQRKKELFQRLSSLGLMAAGVAHELRNPLGSIKGLVNLIDEDFNPGEPKKEYTRVILGEIERLEGTINRFLGLCSGNPKELREEKTDINALLDEILALAKFEPRAAKIKIIRKTDGLPSIISGYPDKLKQSFLNIILNAYDAMPEGGTLKISTGHLNGNIRITFSDTGTGIDEKDIDKIFEPFYTTKDANTGLGLTVSQQVILSHQGLMEVKSEKSKGTSFIITLPERP